jgi:hypothetical protein
LPVSIPFLDLKPWKMRGYIHTSTKGFELFQCFRYDRVIATKRNHTTNIKRNRDPYDQNVNPIFDIFSLAVESLSDRDPVTGFSVAFFFFFFSGATVGRARGSRNRIPPVAIRSLDYMYIINSRGRRTVGGSIAGFRWKGDR